MKWLLSRFLPFFLAAGLFPLVAFAQAYPTKPVRVIIVFPPGGSTDVVGRIVFQKMSEQMDRQFVIENRGGAAGSIGSQVVANSPPDGYTIMVQSTTHVANAHLYKKLPYDVLNDFIGITPLAVQVGMLVVHPALPVKSGKEFIALARKRPGEIVYGSGGNGSSGHLAVELLKFLSGVDMVHVPYKGGGPAATALVSGETQAMLLPIGSLFNHVKSGRARPLGVSSEKRVAAFPDVPAIGEFVPGFEFIAWVGVFAPKNTPRPVIDTLNAELRKVLADPGVASKLTAQTLDPMHMTPEQFAARIKSDYDKYEKLVKISGARID